jgi:hypothetical protein
LIICVIAVDRRVVEISGRKATTPALDAKYEALD